MLCCVCHEHNTTFRYEVVYKSTSGGLQPQKQSPSTVTDLVQQQVTLTTSVEDTEDDSSTHEYYNFPPRHPRHGHLKWSVWRPLVTSTTSPFESEAESVVHESICITTYPDYPVHLPTFTLKRVASVIKQKGKD